MNKLNLPNTLTLSRIFLTPILVVVLLTRIEGKEIYGALIFTVAALTDFLDGYFARKRNQVTNVGKLLDPIADKLLVTSAFISLVELNLAPAWMVVIIVGREFAVSGIRSIAASQGFIMPANWFGKTKTVVQVLTIVVLIVANTYIEPWKSFGRYLLWATLAISLFSAITYLITFLRYEKNATRSEWKVHHEKEETREKIVS
ncbi:MAG TPA: CDP-diacylglycerol--glycerol-3-phosphate 3-phosphatidyltransferase [Acidobacteriota bacterium]|nr:CDP-diacylglycerol--glycerol-3-phosphate 3-phosphatidyltransferase [Acidobacteriota bacterium]